ncbi:hypothetical protein Golomagni_05820 [Golovinomyces magnicellulatus]|nr:hypothetical protein Golomagni_05820 [Golovinomyces magnicellulatus]
MATPKDLQDLLRLLTGRNKNTMMEAMRRVKALQSENLNSISAIASTDMATLKVAIGDEKAAKSLLKACKLHIKAKKNVTDKHVIENSSIGFKRKRSQYELSDQPKTPTELEASLSLPQPSEDEEAISRCVIYTNRAPFLLAFTVQLLKYTMPEQPLSSRLSLGQAVVNFNANKKAASLGFRESNCSQSLSWSPKIKIMNREVTVLKRSGYDWKGDEMKNEHVKKDDVNIKDELKKKWNISKSMTSKKSTFVARSVQITSPSDAEVALRGLFTENQALRGATHTITAWRVRTGESMSEGFNDDGEKNGGQYLLDLLRGENLDGILLVVSRWYGGIMLGPERWRIMSNVSRDCLSQRLMINRSSNQDALWGLNLEDDSECSIIENVIPVFKPDKVRAYLLNAFASPPDLNFQKKKKSGVALYREKEENLGLLLEALDILFTSWTSHLPSDELDRRAWGWYSQTRPSVEDGVMGWGAKGTVKLSDILKLKR